jgi:hypothetical protein
VKRSAGIWARSACARDSIFLPSVAPLSPVSAELFDLSDSARLGEASAATFPVEPDTLHPVCYDWIRPTSR